MNHHPVVLQQGIEPLPIDGIACPHASCSIQHHNVGDVCWNRSRLNKIVRKCVPDERKWILDNEHQQEEGQDQGVDRHHLGLVLFAGCVLHQEHPDDRCVHRPQHKAPLLARVERRNQQREREIPGAIAPHIAVLELMRQDQVQEHRSGA